MCGWLRVAASYIKRRANAVTTSWDEEITDPEVHMMLNETLQRVKSSDPARGRWDVDGDEATVWVDASSLAIGAALEVDSNIIEDACWLRQNDCSHINLSELDAVLRGVNLAVAWKMKRLALMTDSRTVYHWMTDALSGRSRLKTKAASEMLIRRRLETIKTVISEYQLQLEVKFVSSTENKADALTRVPNKWLSPNGKQPLCGAAAVVPECEIARIHQTSGHPGIKRSLYFCRRKFPATTRRQVQEVVRKCEACQSIDPAPVKWQKGVLGVAECWNRVSMDVCHVEDQHYLTLIDCGPSRYAIWRKLRRQDAAAVTDVLESVFYERGAPKELLTDNATSFRSSTFNEFARRWGINVIYRCAHVPSGNGISERCHRSVKTIAARKPCTIAEAVYRYNVMPRDDSPSSAPANKIFRYEVRLLGMDTVSDHEEDDIQHRFAVGDRVWVRHPSRRCNARSSIGSVTKVVSPQKVEVDGMPRHVRDLRPATQPPQCEEISTGDGTASEDENRLLIRVPAARDNTDVEGSSESEEESPGRPLPRRGSRERRPVRPFQYSDLL